MKNLKYIGLFVFLMQIDDAKSQVIINSRSDNKTTKKAMMKQVVFLQNEKNSLDSDSNFLYIHKPENDGHTDYQKKKIEWIKNYPYEYKAWVKENVASKHKIDASEFNTMPQEKRNHILNNLDKYVIMDNDNIVELK